MEGGVGGERERICFAIDGGCEFVEEFLIFGVSSKLLACSLVSESVED